MIRVEPLRPEEEPSWDRFVEAHPQGSPFHTTAWLRCVRDGFGHRPCSLVARDGEEILAILPLFLVRSWVLGRVLVSTPYAVYGGMLGTSREARARLLDEARRLGERERVRFVDLRHRYETEFDLPETNLYVTFSRELPANPEACLQRLPRKARAAARKAIERHGLRGEAGWDSLGAFHRLFVWNKRHLGSPAIPRVFFELLAREFHDRALLWTVRHEGELAAGVFTFLWRDQLLPYFSGGHERYEPMQVNNYLYLSLMQYGVREGYRVFDFGRSRRDSGSFRFKRHQGFEPEPMHYQYLLLAQQDIPHVNPSNPRYDRLRKLWSRLPLPLVRALGGPVIRHLP